MDTQMMSDRRGWWRDWGAIWAFGVREYRLWQSYRVNQVLWVARLLVTTTLFFLLGQMSAARAGALIGPAYGGSYMAFIVIGITAEVFIVTNLSDPYFRVRRAYFDGTMDLFLLSPMSIYTPVIGLMARSVLDDYPRLFVTGGAGMLLFGAVFEFRHWLPALAFTLLLLAVAFGIGLISASSFYLLDIKQGSEPVQFIVQQVLGTLLAGTFYPITVLPPALQWLACAIPHTYALDALRRLLGPGAQIDLPVLPIQHALPGWPPIAIDAAALGLLTALLLPAGFWLYGRGIERARRMGSLTRWQ